MVTRSAEARLAAVHSDLEAEGMDDLSLEVSNATRNLRCASAEEIVVTSWDEFQKFWDRNRGDQLVFLLVDKYGPDSPVVNTVKGIIADQAKIDTRLHTLYMALKKGGSKTEENEGEPAGNEQVDEALAELEGSSDAGSDEDKK